MAVESPIEASHELFAGEDRLLTYVMDPLGDNTGIDGWDLSWSLYRIARGSGEPVEVATRASGDGVVGVPANQANPAVVNVTVLGSQTAGLGGDDDYRHVLRRIDVPGVLSYGGVVLRDAVTAT